jgi:hypothetical protein
MKQEDLKDLSREELEIMFCDFYNSLDKEFDELRGEIDNRFAVGILYSTYIHSSKKVLHKIQGYDDV